MVTISDAQPLQWWPYVAQTYNEQQFAFADKIPFYQEFQIDDNIKIQFRDSDLTKEYVLVMVDNNGIIINIVDLVHTSNYYQLNFQSQTLPNPVIDSCVRFYIVVNDGSFTFDLSFDYTFTEIDTAIILYKTDFINFSSSVRFDASWGSKLIGYKSTKNFAGISYPNDDTYFYLRIPCQFFRQQPKGTQESIPSGANTLVATSIVKGIQQLMKTIYVPDYIHNKLQLIFQHCASGQVLIDGKTWIMEDGYALSVPDEKSPLQMGKIWLSDANYLIRNMV